MSDPRDQLDALLPPDPGAGRTDPLPAVPAGAVPTDLPKHLRDRLGEAPGPDRSVQTAGLVAAAVEWGLDDGQVVALALAHRPTREKYGKRVEREAVRLLGKFRPDHQHLGRPCDRAGCPNAPRWMTGPPAEPVPTRPAGSEEPQEGAPVDLLAGLRDGAWLDAQHFPPLAYAVPGLIPEGSVLLVGPPKIGKSWLVLTVALAAAAGGKALSLTIPKRPVLYLALEDGDRRLQDRCRKLLRGHPIPREFQYLLRPEQGRVIDTITTWLDRQHDVPPLVILDTLGKVMPPALVGESSYQRDYRIGTTLKRIADDHAGMCLLTNHHDRKAAAEDWVDSVSGTHGLAGAADTVIVLNRARHATSGLLKVTGRDVPEGEYAVMVADGFAWDLDGADLAEAAARAREARLTDGVSDRSAEIIAFVAANPPRVMASQVEEKFGKDAAATSSACPTSAAYDASPAASTPVSQVSHRPNRRSARTSNGTTGHRRPKPRRISDQPMGQRDTWDTTGKETRMSDPDGIPWLTDPQRDFLAHLTTLTLLPQMQRLKPDRGYTYDRLSDALGTIADDGDVILRADGENVYVLISGQVIVHAARDWLEYMTPRWAAAKRN